MLLNPSLIDPWDLRGVLLHNIAHPVVNVSFAIDRWLSGFSSFGFHTTNFVLHTVAVGLFYGWCTRALGDVGRPGSSTGQTGGLAPPESPGPEWPAFFAAAAFALHPAMTQAAEYVSARSELLGACAVLVCLTYARRAIVASNRTAAGIATLAGVIAVGSSAAAAALPLLVLAYDAWVLRDPGWRRRSWRVYMPTTAAIGLAASWRLSVLLAADRVPERSVIDNLLTQAIVVWRYVGLLLIPAGQAIVHDVHWVVTPLDPVAVGAVAGVIAAIVMAVRIRKSAPLVAFGIVWFLAALLPFAVPPLRDPMMEQRLYVASLGLILAAATALSRPLATRRTVRVLALITVLVLAGMTRARNTLWSGPMTIWEEAVRRAPDAWQAHFEYAEALREVEQCERALPEYDAALRLNPRLAAADGRSACARTLGR